MLAPTSATKLRQNHNLESTQIPASLKTKTYYWGSPMCHKNITKLVELLDGRPQAVEEPYKISSGLFSVSELI